MSQKDPNHESPENIKQNAFISHLLAGKSITDASAATGISRQTATRWMHNPTIQKALAKGSQEIAKSAYDIIKSKYTDALEAACDVVVAIAKADDAPAVARLKAVQMIQERLAPIVAEPLQGQGGQESGHVDAALLPYVTAEELATIDNIVHLAEQRKLQAEQDREALERKRA